MPANSFAIALDGCHAKDITKSLLCQSALKPDTVLAAQRWNESFVVLIVNIISEKDNLGPPLDDRLDDAVESLGHAARKIDLLQTTLDNAVARHSTKRPDITVLTAPSDQGLPAFYIVIVDMIVDGECTTFKIIIVGASGVGKTALVMNLLGTPVESPKPTVGVEFLAHELNVNGEKVRLQIWDTAGQERFRAMSRAYFRNAMGAILMFDTTNRSSFDALSVWLTDLHQLSCPNSVVLLVGNKNDLVDQRQVGASEAESFAKHHNLQYMDTSALTGANVNETFMYLAEEVVARIKNGVLTLPSMGTANSKKIELKDTTTDVTDESCC